jgi:hypothetical protein
LAVSVEKQVLVRAIG